MLDIDYTALGKRIASLRRKRRLTQEQLAEKTELSTNYISHIENSRSIPSLETLMICTPSERRLVDRFIDLLLDERNHRQ